MRKVFFIFPWFILSCRSFTDGPSLAKFIRQARNVSWPRSNQIKPFLGPARGPGPALAHAPAANAPALVLLLEADLAAGADPTSETNPAAARDDPTPRTAVHHVDPDLVPSRAPVAGKMVNLLKNMLQYFHKFQAEAQNSFSKSILSKKINIYLFQN